MYFIVVLSLVFLFVSLLPRFLQSMETRMLTSSPRNTHQLETKRPLDDEVLEVILDSSARSLKMWVDSFYLPKENPLKPLGEDAHFICDEQQTIGVADGVGGWAEWGIDSGIYARELMDNAVSYVQDQPKGAVNPKQVLKQAFLNTESEGASTACIISLKDNFLHAVNLGDSGFMVLRQGKVVYVSPAQQMEFNCPYQLGKSIGQTPDSAEEIVVEVQPGDILVAATDGLFDNLFPDQIEEIVKTCDRVGNPPELMAKRLGKVAQKLSLLEHSISPFTRAAMDVGLYHCGGKHDDITVIVGYIY